MKKILSLFVCIMLLLVSACSVTGTSNSSTIPNYSGVLGSSVENSSSDEISDSSVITQDSTSSSSLNQSKQLATPSGIAISENLIVWNKVENAVCYNVHILPNNVIESTEENFISLEPYFSGNKELLVSIQAVAEEGSSYLDSIWSELITFTITGESVVKQRGLGSSVNLLTGGCTDFTGTSIFDETLFNRLNSTEDPHVKGIDYTSSLSEGLDSYLLNLNINYANKINMTGSAESKLSKTKIGGGYKFELDAKYERHTYSKTSALFYDSEYYYIDRKVSLEDNDISKISTALSQEFLDDARKLESGLMTAASFIDKYGTNIVTVAIYGASFKTHYELITDEYTVNRTFSTDIQSGISAQISGTVKGVDLGVDAANGESINFNLFNSASSSEKYSKFHCSSNGGGVAAIGGNSLEAVKSANINWANGVNKENCVILDLPSKYYGEDKPLTFVWDFLDSSYADAKEILMDYFITNCNEQYYLLKDKVNSMYSERAYFDEETGVLTVDFSGIQTYEKADLTDVEYPDWLEKNGVFTVYSAYNYVPVKKVVFKGRYNTKNGTNDLITTKFENFAISFDDDWVEDIVLEFDSFAFEAHENICALDFSQTKNSNITISIVNKASITGGLATASGVTGCMAINAENKKLSIIGNSEDGSNPAFDVVGGNGAEGRKGTGGAEGENGKPGETGGAGGTAVIAYSLLVTNVDLDFTGGIGGQGGKGGWGNGALFNPAKGGKGGTGGNGSEYNFLTDRGKGGNGGTGGAGGNALNCNYYDNNELTSINLIAGEGGAGGDRGINQKESGLEGSNGATGSSGAQLKYNEIIEAVIEN